MRLLLAMTLALPLAACTTPAAVDPQDTPMKVTVTVTPPIHRAGLPPLVPLTTLGHASSIAPGTATASGGGPGR